MLSLPLLTPGSAYLTNTPSSQHTFNQPNPTLMSAPVPYCPHTPPPAHSCCSHLPCLPCHCHCHLALHLHPHLPLPLHLPPPYLPLPCLPPHQSLTSRPCHHCCCILVSVSVISSPSSSLFLVLVLVIVVMAFIVIVVPLSSTFVIISIAHSGGWGCCLCPSSLLPCPLSLPPIPIS